MEMSSRPDFYDGYGIYAASGGYEPAIDEPAITADAVNGQPDDDGAELLLIDPVGGVEYLSGTVNFDQTPLGQIREVRVNEEFKRLDAVTLYGYVGLEVHRVADEGDGSKAEFRPGVSATDADGIRLPEVVLGEHDQFRVVIRAADGVTDVPWSPSTYTILNRTDEYGDVVGMTPQDFLTVFPNIQVDLPDGLYDISALQRTKETTLVCIRPVPSESQDSTDTPETPPHIMFFEESGTIPGTFEATVQGSEFDFSDVHKGRGVKSDAEYLEAVVLKGETVEYDNFVFLPKDAPPSYPLQGRPILSVVESDQHAVRPSYVANSNAPVRKTQLEALSPIAAFRFAIKRTGA